MWCECVCGFVSECTMLYRRVCVFETRLENIVKIFANGYRIKCINLHHSQLIPHRLSLFTHIEGLHIQQF